MPPENPFTLREASAKDGDAMLALLPRLADFEVPPWRHPEDLWRGDAELLRRWLRGEAKNRLVWVAVDAADQVLAMALASLRPEPLSKVPSAHLEMIAVTAEAEGQGIGKALLLTIETASRDRGAEAITLHVIATNTRARRIYEQQGYHGDMLVYIKPLG